MPIILEQFVQTLCNSGLMTKDDVNSFVSRLADGEKPKDGQELATMLFRQGKLTKFQAQTVYRGKTNGLILGDYVVLDELGAGGMGQVFRAQHRRMKRTVALKILPAELTKSETSVNRFHQEVEAAARLIHPNVVTAFDAGVAKKIHFLVMEFVEGKDLDAVVAERGPLPVATVIDYVLQAARGLAYAHSEGVIHRDIKPANLLLDKKGTVKILDMGLARATPQGGVLDATVDRGLTQSGDIMGTVDYMSPEQAASTKHVDERADVYSLGCTMFFLLTGRPIYEGDTLVERVLAHREKKLPNLKKVRGDVPQTLASAFRRMVNKKPELRFSSMDEVVKALEQCEAPQSTGTPSKAASSGSLPSAETQTPARTTVAVSLPESEESAAPPPPALTPRDRTRVAVPREIKKKQALERAKATQQKSQRKDEWVSAVKSAVGEQKRKSRWEKVGRILTSGVATLSKWVLVAALVGGVAFGGFYLWKNSSRLTTSREHVLPALNKTLTQRGFEAIPAVEFADTSILRPVPQTLSFEHRVFRTDGEWKDQTFMVKGQFDRIAGTVEITGQFTSQFTVAPVP